ncbi:MAG: patatin-like phospholipase family protein [Deltaproteobacteria bacterium]|nr:MAG: patatin-like phospholipase family protein [Deltaproteobacteria bacterium]
MKVKRAVVLSGGGARGAYEAGVLRYVLEELPRRLGRAPHFDVICGTSVGALHACFLAATAGQGPHVGSRLADLWRSFKIGEVLPVSARELLRWPRRLVGLARVGSELRSDQPPDRLYGLFNTEALERIVLRSIPWSEIRRNIVAGRVEALSVTATQISTGRAFVFIENRDGPVEAWPRDRSVVAQAARILPLHALASAAIPMLFPAVRIGSSYYADGGLRLNTPILPAMRLGADRVLVIGLQYRPTPEEEEARIPQIVEAYGNPLFLFGKVLNAILLDHVSADLRRMQLVNEILTDGRELYGPDFLDRINALSMRKRGHRLRLIDDLLIRPSEDLGMMAGRLINDGRVDVRLSPFLRLFLRSFGTSTSESDLLSYLLFDAAYAAPLVELGFNDARAQEERFLRFFSDEPMRDRGEGGARCAETSSRGSGG